MFSSSYVPIAYHTFCFDFSLPATKQKLLNKSHLAKKPLTKVVVCLDMVPMTGAACYIVREGGCGEVFALIRNSTNSSRTSSVN